MHKAVRDFCLEVKLSLPDHFVDRDVLDCGSLDINGNNRYLFEDCRYTGIDVGEGPNVDEVSLIHDWDGEYDTIISTEAFEHDMFYRDSIANIVRMLRPGGLFLFTCATTGRPEHGTSRKKKRDAPLLEWEHYLNITEDMISDILEPLTPSEFRVKGLDLQYYGVKQNEMQDLR